ncbi:hypothetical protein ACFLXQ_05475 [Chloroflexota bacterium]
MDYGKVITESFNIFLKHRSLWVFGIMAAIFGQSDYSFSVNYQESVSFSPGDVPSLEDFPFPFQNTVFTNFLENPIPYIAVAISISLVWWVISNIFGWLAQGAMIGMVDEADRIGSTSLGSGWRTGVNRLFPLFVITLLLALPALIAVIPAVIWGLQVLSQFLEFFTNPNPEQSFESIFPLLMSGLACLVPLICLGGLMGWVLGLLNQIAARSCVLESLGVIDSIKRGWRVMMSNLGYTLLTWLILVVTGMIFGFVAAMPALVLWIPTARAMMHGNWSATSTVIALIMGVYFIIAVVGIGGMLTSFNSTLWTKSYKAFVANIEA